MPAIPEFVLRKLFVTGSLQPCEDGFTFELNNVLSPVTLTGLAVTSDGTLCISGFLFVALPELGEMPAAGISPERPFLLPLNMAVKIRVNGVMPQERLVIRADTKEAGTLQFSVPLEKKEQPEEKKPQLKPAEKGQTVEKIKKSLRYAAQVFRVQQDPQHPGIHFTPPSNWMNDPNGLLYWKGKYHLFYQYNPFEPAWGNIHWGHAISHDMLHWKHQPIALAPDPDGPDSGGCFSGCAVSNLGVPTLIYTGVFPETQCMAVCDSPDLKKWKKHSQPIIPSPPEGMQLEGFRDPCVWKQDGEWRMIVGSGILNEGGAIFLYRSSDLLEWQYMGIFFQKNSSVQERIWTGTMWECPSFFPLREKWVLIISACAPEGGMSTLYYMGDYLNDRFIPDGDPRQLDFGAGSCFYAPQTFEDGLGRRVMFGWLREAREVEEIQRAGWSGAMSLPRVLSLGENGDMVCTPLDGIKKIRGEHECLEKQGQYAQAVKGSCFEAIVSIPPTAEQWSGIHITTSQKSGEHILIGCDHINSAVVVDCRKAGGMINIVPVSLPTIDELKIHLFVDGSIVEVFVDDCMPVSARFYVKKPQSLRVRLVGDASAELWELKL